MFDCINCTLSYIGGNDTGGIHISASLAISIALTVSWTFRAVAAAVRRLRAKPRRPKTRR